METIHKNLNCKIDTNNIKENVKIFNIFKNEGQFQNLIGKDKDLIRRMSTSFDNLLKDIDFFISRSADISSVLNGNSFKIDTQVRIILNMLSKLENNIEIKDLCKKLSKSDYITKKDYSIITEWDKNNRLKKKK